MSEKSRIESFVERHLTVILVAIVGIAILAVSAVLLTYFYRWSGPVSGEHQIWGQFGDYVGGVLNPFLAFLALTALLLTLRVQSQELVESSRALRESADAFRKQNEQAAKESAEKRSQFYLDSCVGAYARAQSLLEDGNNDRDTWIAAGRALKHAKQLATDVTVDAHLRVLELERLMYRGFFHKLLQSKTAASFYGARVGSTFGNLDEAARASSLHSEIGQLDERSLYAVWEAAQWPRDYEDPLNRTFSPEEREHLGILFPRLHDYLEHRQQWHSVNGQLVRNPDQE